MPLDLVGTLLLVVTSAISFFLGRTFVNWRKKKREREAEALRQHLERNKPPEMPSLNKSKRKRQAQQAGTPQGPRP
ncbi:MAG: hypothetical protein V4731_19115 [Pseudomonadota bacterium]